MSDGPVIAEEITNTYASKLWRMHNLYKIRDKMRRLLRFQMNPIQRVLADDVLGQQALKRGARHFTLKARQVGISTLWVLWWLDDTITRRNTITGLIAHQWDNVKMLMEIVDIAYQNLPERWRPPLGDDNKFGLSFPTLQSKLFSALTVRSTAVHNLHISEWCFCADENIGAALAATSVQTNITGESTGNGVGNDGYTIYHRGKKKENDYIARFFPWFLQPEYAAPPGGLIGRVTDAERKFIAEAQRAYGVTITDDQLLWRRSKMSDLRGMFPQEYPESDEDAFRTSGSKFFDYKKSHRLLLEAKAIARETPPVAQTDDYVQFEHPTPKHVYVAGADTADEGNDFSVLKIINVTERREAFVFRARCGVDAFYRICDEWCRLFNNALLAVELNNHGRAVILGLEIECRYPNLYAEEVPRRDAVGLEVHRRRVGWLTTRGSKTAMLDELKFALEGDSQEDADHFAPSLLWRDQWLLGEILTIESRHAKIGAIAGEFDDDVMATAIAVQMYNQRRRSAHREGHSIGFVIGGQREFAA